MKVNAIKQQKHPHKIITVFHTTDALYSKILVRFKHLLKLLKNVFADWNEAEMK